MILILLMNYVIIVIIMDWTKTTNTTLTCLTGFEVHGQAACVKPENEVNSINANGLYVIRKAGSNRAGFIKFDN